VICTALYSRNPYRVSFLKAIISVHGACAMFELPHSNTPVARKISCGSAGPDRNSVIIAYAETDGIGMGRLSDGTPYLTQRGLAALCGVQNAHIGRIGRDWATLKPRILAIKTRLGTPYISPHRVLLWAGRRQYVYDMAVCEAVLDYYALDADEHIQPEAQANRLRFRRESLGDYILTALTPPPEPITSKRLRFRPLRRPVPETYDALDAIIIYVCGLFALSAWMANTYLEGLKQRALNAPWNRLGLYLPLRAILEIQAEAVLRMNGTFNVR
jgi:hypothetical protein